MTLTLPMISPRSALALFVAAFTSAILAFAVTPKLAGNENVPQLDSTVPHAFGEWVELPSPLAQVSLSTGGDTTIDQPYDQTVLRTYRNNGGQVVQLALAWGANQRQEVKIHRPDLCYVAQGYRVQSLVDQTFQQIRTQQGGPVKGKHMIAESGSRIEAVSYWIRIGDLYSEDAVDTRLKIFRDGLAGKVPDGILVRASISGRNINEANQLFPLVDAFLEELVASLGPPTRAVLVQ
jgi:EpsI family protein